MEELTTKCDCTDCRVRQRSQRSVPRYSTLEKVQRAAESHTASILHSHQYIKQCRRVHDSVISSTVAGKSASELKKLLKHVLPDIPDMQRPDFAHQQRTTQQVIAAEAMDTPQLNCENLVAPGVLLCLLHSRGDNPPYKFTFSDLDNAGLSWEDHDSSDELQKVRAVFFDGAFGSFEALSKLQEEECEYLGFDPVAAVHALYIQRRIMSFLEDVCVAILNEHSLDTTLDHLQRCEDGPPSAMAETSALHLTSAIHASAQLPCTLSIDELDILISAGLSQAKDHVNSLISDPDYFLQQFRDQEAHIPLVPGYLEKLRADYAEKQPEAKVTKAMSSKTTTTAYMMTGQACFLVVHIAFYNLIMWHHLNAFAIQLESYKGETCRTAHEKQPEGIEAVFCHMQHLLSAIAVSSRDQLTWAFPASPKMKKFFNTAEVSADNPNALPFDLDMNSLSVVKEMNADTRWAFKTIEMLATSEPGVVGYRGVLSEVEHLFSSKRSSKTNITPFIRENIARIVAVGHLHEALGYFYPASALYACHAAKARTHVSRAEADIAAFGKVTQRICMGAMFQSGALQYPEADPGCKNTHQARRKTEEIYGEFWGSLAEKWNSASAAKCYLDLLRDVFASCDSPEHTGPWVDDPAATLSTGVEELEVGSSNEPSLSSLLSKKAKVKQKTRPLVPVTQDVQENEAAREEPAPLVLSVDATTYDTFDKIYNMSGGTRSGELAFNALERAMCKIGFSANHALGGSTVTFEPLPEGVKGLCGLAALRCTHLIQVQATPRIRASAYVVGFSELWI